MGLSTHAYACHHGVPHVAVRKAIDTGWITPLPDGTADPNTANARWVQNTLQSHRAVVPEEVSPPKTRVLPEHEVSESGAPPLSTSGILLLQARTVNEVLKAQFSEVELAYRKKELVGRAQTVAHMFKLVRIERDA